MKLSTTKYMPERGRFIAIWTWNKQMWSATLQWNDGSLKMYEEQRDAEDDFDAWVSTAGISYLLKKKSTRFVIMR